LSERSIPVSVRTKAATARLADWAPKFFKSELAPYPGRAGAVARITISVVITFILTMTFRIPYAFLTLYIVFTVTRDSPNAAVRSAITCVAAVAAGLSLSLTGVVLTIDEPPVRFVWVIGEFLVLFWLARVLIQPSAATYIGLAVYISSNIWALPYPAEQHLQETLWLLGSLALGTGVAVIVELVFVRQDPIDQILKGISQRLQLVESFLRIFREDPESENTSAARNKVISLSLVGTGRLRGQLRSAENGQPKLRQYLAELNSQIALSSRLVDLAANLSIMQRRIDESDRKRLAAVSDCLAGVRTTMLARLRAQLPKLPGVDEHSEIPLLPEIERTVRLMQDALASVTTLRADVLSVIDETPRTQLFRADAFTDMDYVKFALKGCLAAMICYVVYSGLDAPGLATSVFTCLTTALSTVGASRQKQVLRIGGVTVGGLLSIGALVFLLPNIDSITVSSLVIAVVAAGSGWIATSSPRLSYFGQQMGLAFFFSTLQDFGPPTSLAPARDRFLGVLLGLTMMWIVFDQLWPTQAVVEIRRLFERNLRLLAQLAVSFEHFHEDRVKALPLIHKLREEINDGFTSLQAQTGTIFFEFGPERPVYLALREQVLHWQSYVRTIFLIELGIIAYRIQIDPRQIPENVVRTRSRFDLLLARELEDLAKATGARLPSPEPAELNTAFAESAQALEDWFNNIGEAQMSIKVRGILDLSRKLVQLVHDLHEDMSRARILPDTGIADPVLRPAS